MKHLNYKRLLSIIISLSIFVAMIPTNVVLADTLLETTEAEKEFSTPEQVSNELLDEQEQVIFPIDGSNLEEKDTENIVLEDSQTSVDVMENITDIEADDNAETQSTQKPIIIVDFEDAPRNQVQNEIQAQPLAANSELSGKDLYYIGVLENNEYNNNVSGDVTVNQATGNVNYSYNLASIPGKNGSVMSLDIEYNNSQSQFGIIGADITDAKTTYMKPYLHYQEADCNLGAGWEFSMLKRGYIGGYYKLRDGTIVKRDDRDNLKSYTIDRNGNIIYTDGTTEYISGEGYLECVEDKYGNKITYTYEDGIYDGAQDTTRLKSITDSLNRTITIDYYDDYIDVKKPDNSVVRIYTENITVEHVGAYRGFDETLTVKEITQIQNITDNKTIASFEYNPMEFRWYVGPAGIGIQGDDYAICMELMQADLEFNGVRNIEYTIISDKKTDPPYIQSREIRNWYVRADKIYLGDETIPQATYSYEFDEEYIPNLTVKEVSADNCVTETCLNTNGSTHSYTQNIYERKNNNDILKQSKEEWGVSNDKTRLPSKITTKIYNENGNYITTQSDYTYDKYGNMLTYSEQADGNMHIEHEYTYYPAANHYAMKNHIIKKGTNVLTETEYTVNDIGDITSETIYDGGYDLQRRTVYRYSSNHNITEKEIYKGYSASTLQKEYYTYTGAYLTRKYATDQSENVIADEHYLYDNMTGRLEYAWDCVKTEILEYDSLGRVTKEAHSGGTYKQISYNNTDRVIGITDENNYENEYWYNKQGKLQKYTEKTAYEDAHMLQHINYDAVGNPIEVQDALNNTTSITYDAFGRQTSVKYPGNSATAKAKYYDVFLEGNEKYSVYLTISETGKIACEYYDIYGRLVKTALIKNYSSFSESNFNNIYQMPSSAQLVITSRYVYDDFDRVIEQYDGENRPTYYTYDAMGNVVNMKQGNANTTTPQIDISYEYDSAGNVIKMTQGAHITTYEYDYAGRLIKTTDPMGYTETYTYDTAGNVKTATDKNGTVTTNTYNNRGLLKKTAKNGEYIEYTYDGVGNILTSKDKNGTISYTYNQDGTLASKTYPDGKVITYDSYNGNKSLTSMTDYFGNTTTYTYNARGAVTAIGEKYSGTSTTNTTKYAYNTDGSLQKVTYPLSSYMTSTYTYDYAGRVSSLTNKPTSSSTSSHHTYTYDNSGNVTQKTDTIQGTSTTTAYVYDSLNRLTKETIGSSCNAYSYDQYGNLSGECGFGGDVIYSYDANNRLTDIYDQWIQHETANGQVFDDWTIDYTYDNAGKVLSSNTHSKFSDDNQGSIKTYEYDTWGRLTNFSDSLGETASYSYYSDGLRASKKIGSNTTKYYYNGDNVINETLNGNSYATNVIGVDGYVSRRQDGTIGYLFKNAHGDVVSAYSSTTNKIADYTYDAWGEQRTVGTQSWGASNPIRYNGQYYDTESGMTYLRARYYDSSIKRFISEDPHWNVDNMIYGDEQQAVEYRIVDNIKIYYDKYGNVIERKEYVPALFTSIERNNLDGTISIQRIPDIHSILQTNNLYSYCENNPILYNDTSGESVRGVGGEVLVGFGMGISGQYFAVSDSYGNQGEIIVFNFGIETGAALSVEGFYFPNMDSIDDLQGWGFSMGASGAFGGSWIGTDTKWGGTVSYGAGTPEIHVTVGYTWLRVKK